MKRIWKGVVAAFGLLLLILDAKTGIQGAKDGLELCIRSVVPSLFPFFVLSILLTEALTGAQIPALYPLGKLLRMPKGSEAIFLIGILGGYPVGAQAATQAYKAGQLTRNEAQRLLGFCSNAGPSFLFGIVACKFASAGSVWALWAIHILSAILTGILLPGGSESLGRIENTSSISVTDALQKAIRIMASVCGWVILFRVMIAFLTRWVLWLLPQWLQVAVSGALELANGCCTLDSVMNEGLRFILCSAILAFGGLCVAMQTASVTGELGMGLYFPGKLLQSSISVLLSLIIQHFLFSSDERVDLPMPLLVICVVIMTVLSLILRKKQKNSSIPALHSV